MTDKFENIESEEIKLNELGEVELSKELAGAVAGGFSPEKEDDEDIVINIWCGKKEK
jgi:hypothetical protein